MQCHNNYYMHVAEQLAVKAFLYLKNRVVIKSGMERNIMETIGGCVDLKISFFLFLSDKIQLFVLSFYLCGYFTVVLQ